MSDQPSSWAVGWAYFAAAMLMVGGFFQILAGVAAIAKNEILVMDQSYTFKFDVTTWGWIHLILGIVLVIAGIGILSGNLAARIVGIVVAAISAVANFAFLPWYPVWGAIVIAIDVAVIWALTAHGRDIEMS